jgi:thiol-disulfide isomerase/thioredoxin
VKHSTIAALILGLLGGIAVLAAALADDAAPLLDPMPDRPPAPAFDLPGPDGTTHSLAAMQGKPVIVNFWATWCPPCRAEMPSMQRAWEQLKDDDVLLIAINVGESKADIDAFLAEVPVSFPLPMDETMGVSQAWPMKGLPTTFVVDPEGRLVYRAQGEREWDDPKLLDLVRALRR